MALKMQAISFTVWLVLLAPSSTTAHGTVYEIVSEHGIGIRARFDSGAPMAGARVMIFRPGATSATDTAEVDSSGLFFFAPDTPGTWILQVRDRGGHGMRINLPVDKSMSAAAPVGGHGGFTPWRKLLMAVSIVWGFIGTALWFSRRGRKN